MQKAQQLSQLLDLTRLTKQDGMFVSKEGGDRTIWEDLAQVAPIHAAISAKDESAERLKSAEQIEQVAGLVRESTVLLDVGCGYGRLGSTAF